MDVELPVGIFGCKYQEFYLFFNIKSFLVQLPHIITILSQSCLCQEIQYVPHRFTVNQIALNCGEKHR